MANIVVTSTANSVNVVFNNMAQYSKFKRASFYLNQLTFQEPFSGDCIRVYDSRGVPWCVTYPGNPNLVAPGMPMMANGTESLLIDEVNGVAPTDNEHLYSLLEAMRG